MGSKLHILLLTLLINTSIARSECGPYFSELPGHQDLIMAFTAAASETEQNAIQIKINDRVLTENLDYPLINGEQDFKYLVNRNEFNLSAGKQNISLAPLYESLLWGVKDISVKSIPAISLDIGKLDPKTYGYTEQNKQGFYYEDMRYTGARFTFNLKSKDSSLKLSLRASDIDVCDELAIYVNGKFLTNLPVSNRNTGFGDILVYELDSSTLREGINQVKFIQKYTSLDWNDFDSVKWAIKNILID